MKINLILKEKSSYKINNLVKVNYKKEQIQVIIQKFIVTEILFFRIIRIVFKIKIRKMNKD